MNDLSDFDWKNYLFLNPDLEKGGIKNKIDAFYHYVSHGINENRKYKFDVPDDFDYEKYLELNQDLLQAGINNELDAKIHWIKYGKNEKRHYKENNIIRDLSLTHYIESLENQLDDVEIHDPNIKYGIIDKTLLFNKFNTFAILLHIGDNNKNKILFYADLIKFNYDFIIQNNGNVKIFIYLSDYISDNIQEYEQIFHQIGLNINIQIVPNIAMDLLSFMELILDNSFNYDILIKYHTKTISQWSLDNVKCFSSEYNFLLTLSHLYNDNKISIIGDYKWIVPTFYGITDEYYNKMVSFLKEIGVSVDKHDIIDMQNAHINMNNLNYKKYLDCHDDFHEQNMYTKKELKNHVGWIKNNNIQEFRIGLNYNTINNPSIVKYIAGTMFAFRGSVINEIRKKFGNILKSYFPKLEHGLVKDAEGTKFTYTHTFERLPGILSSYLGYHVYGVDYDNSSMATYQDSSIAFNKINIKKTICFISHDLTKTGAPKILLDVIKHFKEHYKCYLIARNSGDLFDEARQILGNDKIFVLMKDTETCFGVGNFLHCIEQTKIIFEKIRPDVCYINSLASSFAIFASYAQGIPSLLHGHEALLEIINLHKTNQTLCYDIGHMVDYCICTDNLIKHYLEKLYNVEHPEVLYNFTNLNGNNEKNKLDVVDHEHKIYKKVIGMAGSICYRKGFDIFIELAWKNSSFQFIWAGIGNYDRSMIPENMIVLQLQPHEMIKFYNSIDLFVLTSRSDACPLVLVEALFNNCPVMLYKYNVQVYDVIEECGGIVIDEYINFDSVNDQINKDYEINIKTELIWKIFSKTNFINKIDSLINKCLKIVKNKHDLKVLEYDNKYKLNFYTKLITDYRSYFHHVNGNIKLIPSNHRIAEEYLIANSDLRLVGLNNFQKAYDHFYLNGRVERRGLYRPPILCMKRVVFVIHSSELTGAPIVGAEIANYLQEYFDVIILSKNIGELLNQYIWKNKPIELKNREFEFGITRYLDRLELALDILKELDPDIVYINSTCSHEYAHASHILDIPMIYHGHEGAMGIKSELDGYIIPYSNCNQNFKNTIYYSASIETSSCMRQYLGIDSNVQIKELQAINHQKIIQKSIETIGVNIKTENRLLFGMVGTGSYRKGVDLFINCATNNPNHDFVWIGKKDDLGHLFDNLPSNMKYLGLQKNPQKFIKQFDYFLLSSREDLFPLVAIESLILDTQVIYYKKNIGADNELEKLGCIGIYEDQDENLSHLMEYVNKYNQKKINKNYLERFYVQSVVDQIIVSDIIKLTGSIINDNLRNIHWNNRYGWITYDANRINKLILDLYKEKAEFNENIYLKKYEDIKITNINPKDHYNKIGMKTGRNCLLFDWKLVIANTPFLLNNNVYDEKTLFKYITENDLDIKNLTKVYFDINKYKKRYNDLTSLKLSDKEIFDHWINYGSMEGRCCISI